jgi:hypothetical protein
MPQETERIGVEKRLSKMRDLFKRTYSLTKKIFNLAS